jgi:hypothetical protein
MKAMTLLTFLLAASGAQAAQVDLFNCSITATKADGTADFSAQGSFASVKQSLNGSPDVDVVIFSSSVAMNASGQSDQAQLTFTYQQALKLDSNGKPIQARQSLCFQVYASLGEFAFGIDCPGAAPDPFAVDAYGWDIAQILPDGSVVFNPQQLKSVTITSPLNEGKTTFSCEYKGSLQ